MSLITYDDQLQWADTVTTTAETDTSAEFLVGEQSKLCCVLVASAATAAEEFTVVVKQSDTSGGTFEEIACARGVITGPTGGGAVSAKIDFTAYRPYIKVYVTAGQSGTIVYDGWITDVNTNMIANQGVW